MSRSIRPEILAHLAQIAARVDGRGWGEATGGNLSLILAEADLANPFQPGNSIAGEPAPPRGRYLLVSATGSRMRQLAGDPASGLALLRGAAAGIGAGGGFTGGQAHRPGLALQAGDPAPTSELPTHLLAQENRPVGSALLHAHPDFLIAMSHMPSLSSRGAMEAALLPLLPETALFLKRGIARISFAAPGTVALARATRAALDRADVLVWDRHGALALGRDLDEAMDRLELAEKAARLWWIARRVGEWPRGLPGALLERMQQELEASG